MPKIATQLFRGFIKVWSKGERASDFGRFNTDEDNTKKPLALSLG